MKLAVFAAVLVVSTPLAAAAQTRRPATPPAPARPAPPVRPAPDRIAEAYEQFLQAHLIEDEDADAAIAAYRRAMALDPASADIPADLAELYMRENKQQEAIQAAEQALRVAPQNRDANRVLGTIYATMAGRPGRGGRESQQQNVTNAIRYLEQAFDPPMSAADANLRAMLARLYIANESYDKAIPVLADLVKQEPGWSEGPTLLIEAYAAAGRTNDAITWLEESAPDNPRLYAALGEFYARGRRWTDAATAYEKALEASPNSFDWRLGMAEALLNAGNRADITRSRDLLREAVRMKATDERALYLLAEAERASGDPVAAETAARKLIAQNPRNQRGFLSLAQALEDQRRYEPIVDALVPALQTFRSVNNGTIALRTLLPHLGFAYQEIGQYDKAIASFEEARRVSPNDASITGYLIQAQLAAKNYGAAAEIARAARAVRPTDVRLARLEAVALRRSGKVDQSVAVLEDFAQKNSESPEVHVALAQGYLDANRGAQAIKTLRDAQTRFPGDTTITFELGAVLDRQKRYAESEAIFRDLIAKDPDNAAALNYLGYMLAERGERLNESVDYLKRALAIEPENGSYLDSIGWAYFKDGKFDLALENMKRAADQLQGNSVVQDHYGDVLFKLGRYDDAIGAWQKALKGDGDTIDKNDLDKKIRSARQKLPKR
jgi:tetratricopeptide (TPR) repeat protein